MPRPLSMDRRERVVVFVEAGYSRAWSRGTLPGVRAFCRQADQSLWDEGSLAPAGGRTSPRQATAAGGQVDLVAIVDVAAATMMSA